MPMDFAGFTAQDIAAYFGLSPANAQALIDLSTGQAVPKAQQSWVQQEARGGGFADFQPGLEHLAEHPKGSEYHGDVNVGDIVGNVATGGLYGAAKSAYGGLSGQENLFDAAKGGLNQLGPWGSSTYNIPGYGPQIAQTGNLIGAGAGIGGGGFGTFSPSGFGAEGAGAGTGGLGVGGPAGAGTVATGSAARGAIDPIYFGFEPGTVEAAGTTEFGQFAGGIPGGGFSGGGAGALGAAAGGSPGTGALTAGSLAQMLGGASPQAAFPQGGAGPVGQASPGGLTPAQVAALSAMNSEAHRGLAPSFESRMRGMQQGPGLAGNAFIS